MPEEPPLADGLVDLNLSLVRPKKSEFTNSAKQIYRVIKNKSIVMKSNKLRDDLQSIKSYYHSLRQNLNKTY